MSANPIDKNVTPKPTGSLEELFRHHLGEEAAVPPRPMLWEQIDNSLLIRQNETYRRRLTATRWVAAASLLLASLAGTGWWSLHDAGHSTTGMATTALPAASGTDNAGLAARNAQPVTAAGTASHYVGATAGQAVATNSSSSNTSATDNVQMPRSNGAVGGSAQAASSGTRAARSRAADVASNTRNMSGTAATPTTRATAGFATPAANGAAASTAALSSQSTPTTTAGGNAGLATTTPATGITAPTGTGTPATIALGARTATAAGSAGALAGTEAAATMSSAASLATAEPVGLLAARTSSLGLTALGALPQGLATVPQAAEPTALPALAKWHFDAVYTAGVFNPNVNFSRKGIEPEYDYNPALGSDSPALTEAAAAQYRENLRPGLSQRIALLATRRLAGRWSVSSGVELSQATAKSASSSAFVGEQILDLGQSGTGPLHTTDFRYRLASIPVEVRYNNPAKRGWSIYGHLGGVVSALLGVRSVIEDNPEATRTYSILSAGAPYRRVLGSVRGGAGAQFRPGNSGSWAFSLGPVAELGLTPLNAHPAQSYLAQSRPYSIGLEAGVEFGR